MSNSSEGRPGIRCIDLSVPLQNFSFDRDQVRISPWNHREGARRIAQRIGFDPDLLPDGQALAAEDVEINTHSGTHLDSPYHFSPTCAGSPARTADEIPLDWCISDGVVLDMTHKGAGDLITVPDMEEAVTKIGYRIKPYDIVLIRTDATKRYEKPDFLVSQPGMGRESTLWLLDQGVKVAGIDAWSFDRPLPDMAKDLKAGNQAAYCPAHFVGKEREYCHVEKLANLDLLPEPFGFKVSIFPIRITRGSAGWVRAVAILEGGCPPPLDEEAHDRAPLLARTWGEGSCKGPRSEPTTHRAKPRAGSSAWWKTAASSRSAPIPTILTDRTRSSWTPRAGPCRSSSTTRTA